MRMSVIEICSGARRHREFPQPDRGEWRETCAAQGVVEVVDRKGSEHLLSHHHRLSPTHQPNRQRSFQFVRALGDLGSKSHGENCNSRRYETLAPCPKSKESLKQFAIRGIFQCMQYWKVHFPAFRFNCWGPGMGIQANRRPGLVARPRRCLELASRTWTDGWEPSGSRAGNLSTITNFCVWLVWT